MTGPLVSIIMPVYNSEAFVAEALESVFAQDYEPLEVIVVNDGSQDRSGEIVRSFPQVRYFEQENRGASAARNHAIAKASGEYLAFVDADDVVPPEKLAVQVGYLIEHPEVAGTLGRQHWMQEPPGLARDQVWGDPDGIPLVSLVVRRSVFLEVGDMDEERGGDMDFLVRLRAAGHTFVVLPDIVLHRRWHGNNLIAGRGQIPLPPISLKAKLDRERARRGEGV
jgi:glycosyltransferase involved in cell wall biosynthesis